MKTTVRVEGLKELDHNLGLLSKSAARRVGRKVLMKAGEPMAISMASRAPVDKGGLALSVNITSKAPHDHRDGFKQFFAAAKAQGASTASAVQAGNLGSKLFDDNAFAQVFIGPDRRPEAIMQEFGTIHHPPQPFVRPAWDAKKRTTLALIVKGLRVEIDKAVSRMKRRAANAR